MSVWLTRLNISIVTALLLATIGRLFPDRRLAAGIATLGVAASEAEGTGDCNTVTL